MRGAHSEGKLGLAAPSCQTETRPKSTEQLPARATFFRSCKEYKGLSYICMTGFLGSVLIDNAGWFCVCP